MTRTFYTSLTSIVFHMKNETSIPNSKRKLISMLRDKELDAKGLITDLNAISM